MDMVAVGAIRPTEQLKNTEGLIVSNWGTILTAMKRPMNYLILYFMGITGLCCTGYGVSMAAAPGYISAAPGATAGYAICMPVAPVMYADIA